MVGEFLIDLLIRPPFVNVSELDLQFVVLVCGGICLCKFGGCRFLRDVHLSGFHGANKVWCVLCVCGMWGLVCCRQYASWFVISLPKIPVCALTFCNVMLCVVHRI